MRTQSTKALHSPLYWYGGKGNSLGRQILQLFPPHQVYVETHGGSGALLFMKYPSPVEVYNDLHDGAVTLFRVLRDPVQGPELQRRLTLTPVSRSEWRNAAETWASEPDPILKAWKYFIVGRQTFTGGGRNSISGWAFARKSCKGVSNLVYKWLSVVEDLDGIIERLRMVQIDNDSYEKVLERYDGRQTLFYVDPPYVHDTRADGSTDVYRHEMSLADHRSLVTRLLALQGMVVLSGYQHEVYRPLEAAGWLRKDFAVTAHTISGDDVTAANGGRVESVWRNPACLAYIRTTFGPSRQT